MAFSVDLAYVATILLVSIRFGALLVLSPLFSIGQVPAHFRILLIFGLSTLVFASLRIAPVASPLTLANLITSALSELFIGALLAFGFFTAFAAFLFGGRILDFQMGFGVANLIDPITKAQGPLIGTFLNLTGVMIFFLVNGHHMMLRGLAFSLEKLPPGIPVNQVAPGILVAQFGIMFSYGIVLVAPAILVLLLLDVGMAIAARTMPQVNMFIVGIPLKIFVGLITLAVSLNYLSPLLEKIYVSIFRYWEAVLG